MSRRREGAAKRDLHRIATLRHQLASAKMARLVRHVQAAEHKEQALAEQLQGLIHETRLAQSACLSKVTDNLGGLGVYQGLLRVLDLEIRRTEVRRDMQAEECHRLRHVLTEERRSLERLEIRLDLYKKMLRLAKAREMDRRDDHDD